MSVAYKFSGTTIVLSVALQEEFDEVRRHFAYKDDCSTDRHVRLEFEIDQTGFRLIGVLAATMGAQAALEAVEEAIEDFDPSVVICLGISGAISDDLQPGDVCVSNIVYDINHNAKISSKRGKAELDFSPRPYEVAAPLATSATFARNHPTLADRLAAWRLAGEQQAKDLAISLMFGRPPELFIGAIACGPLVASKEAKEKLRSIDRRFLAIDMESGGVFNRLSRKNVPGLAIRGISDMADETKSNYEKNTKGAARKLAMQSALRFLDIQLSNPMFMNFLASTARSRQPVIPGLETKQGRDPVEIINEDIAQHLDCRTFGGRLPAFRLPMPRVREVSYIGELSSRELEKPEDIASALERHDRLLIRIPRSFPSQTLAWSLAHALLREGVGGKVAIPIVVDGRDLKPPRRGLKANWNQEIGHLDSTVYEIVYIVEEPLLHDRHRVKFLLDEVANEGKRSRLWGWHLRKSASKK